MKYLIPAVSAAVLVAACSVTAKQRVVVEGQLYCAMATASGPLIVAIANAAGAPVVVTGMASQAVAAICAAISAIPVAPPVDEPSAPVVAVEIPPVGP